MLNVAEYFSYVSVLDKSFCVFVSEVMVRRTSFVMIRVLLFVINTREVYESNAFEVQMAIKKLKRHKSPGIDQIPAEQIKTEDRTFLINSA
jgi:hypothetical protein